MPETPINPIPHSESCHPRAKRRIDIPNSEEPRIGVYICHCGGNISDTVRVGEAAEVLGNLPNVVVSRDYQFMCSDPGQKLVTDDIKEKGVNRVVVGACSLFLHEQTFHKAVERGGINPYLYYHVGLREQDSWVHHAHPSEATDKAVRMMSAGVAKARLMRPMHNIELTADKHALVIGGGVAGLRSALSIARRGLRVTLLEKSPFLGGNMARWDHVFPTEDSARDLLHGLIEEVIVEPNITVHTGAEVVGAKGYVGNFEVHIRQQRRGVAEEFAALGSELVDKVIDACPVEVVDNFNFGLSKRKAIYKPYQGAYPSNPTIDWEHCTRCEACLKVAPKGSIRLYSQPIEFDLKVGAVVVATGFQPYEPARGELGYGEFPGVVTLPQLERMLSHDGPTDGKLEINGHPVRSMALIHCVGSRQVDGIHAPRPDGRVNDYCSRVCCTASLAAANRIRERFPKIDMFDVYQDIRTYGRGHEEYYLRASKNRVTFFRYLADDGPQVVAAEPGDEYPLLVRVKDHLTWGEEVELPVDMVVLAVGMRPSPIEDLIDMLKLAPGNEGFLLEVHPKLRPVETAVTGVVLAGTAQGPMNIQESCAAAEAAASKVAVLLGRGKAELEPYVATVDPERCQGSGECVRVCPQEGAIHLESFTENGETVQRAVVTAANCNGCGICVSACPSRAIDVQGWWLDEFEAMVEAIAGAVPAGVPSGAPALEAAK
jgi:heterodisulfide reductase subunit A